MECISFYTSPPLLQPAYEVRREGNTFPLYVCSQGVPPSPVTDPVPGPVPSPLTGPVQNPVWGVPPNRTVPPPPPDRAYPPRISYAIGSTALAVIQEDFLALQLNLSVATNL